VLRLGRPPAFGLAASREVAVPQRAGGEAGTAVGGQQVLQLAPVQAEQLAWTARTLPGCTSAPMKRSIKSESKQGGSPAHRCSALTSSLRHTRLCQPCAGASKHLPRQNITAWRVLHGKPQGPGRTVVCFARGVDLRRGQPVSMTPGMERRACAMGLYSAPQRRSGRALRLTYTEKALGLRKACPSNRISPLGPRSGAHTQLSKVHRRAHLTRAPGVRAPRCAGAPTSFWLVD